MNKRGKFMSRMGEYEKVHWAILCKKGTCFLPSCASSRRTAYYESHYHFQCNLTSIVNDHKNVPVPYLAPAFEDLSNNEHYVLDV